MYANGDVYSGLWAAGKCEGPGRYRWRNGNEYNGEWRAGCMHGQGTLRWNTGAPPATGKPTSGHGGRSSAASCCTAMLTPNFVDQLGTYRTGPLALLASARVI